MKTQDSTFTPLTPEEIRDIPLGYTRDSFGNTLTFENSKGYWEKYTLDSFGKPLTFENSRGYWEKYTRDSFGKTLTFKNSCGISTVFLGESDGYRLWYNLSNSKYEARCFKGTYQDAMNRWNILERTDDRALLFTSLIRVHHESLGKT
jgi:hypothetical protein